VRPIERVYGRGLPLGGANIDTDRIVPARFLRTVSFDGLERHVFEDDRAAMKAQGQIHPFDDRRFEGASILIVNNNFGCGSSREHAPQALYRRGIRAVIGESFSDIFFGNALMLGMPCVTATSRNVALLQQVIAAMPQVALSLDLTALLCSVGGDAHGRPPVVAALAIPIELPSHAREAFTTGAWDGTALLLERYDEVERVAAKLPYL
jgi:3-isopropylmalate/(R)-2-methylmalate dehydratase small subunit